MGRELAALLAAGAITLVPGLIRVGLRGGGPPARRPARPGRTPPGTNRTSPGSPTRSAPRSKVWYTLGNGELENVFYPETDTPDTFGLQYVVTNGTSFASTETTGTSHTISLADPDALVWQQVNNATNGDFTITKTYIADPSRSVVLVQTTFDNLTLLAAAALRRLPSAAQQRRHGQHRRHRRHQRRPGGVQRFGVQRAGRLDRLQPDQHRLRRLVQRRRDRADVAATAWASTYSSASGRRAHRPGRADPGGAPAARRRSRSRSPSTPASPPAISDASASLAAGFSSLESSFESGWHSWLGGLHSPPASVTGSAAAAGAVQRLADGGEGRRGQDLRGRVRRRADRPVGRVGQRGHRHRDLRGARLSRGLDAGRVRDGHGAARGRGHHRRAGRAELHLRATRSNRTARSSRTPG